MYLDASSCCFLFFLAGWCSRTWNWELSLTLQEGGVGLDELVRRDIADGDTRHDGGIGRRKGERVVLTVVPLRGVFDKSQFESVRILRRRDGAAGENIRRAEQAKA